MEEFVSIITSYPTVVWTVLLGVAVVYWILAVVGMLDLDVLDFGGDVAEGAVDGALEGADGALEAEVGDGDVGADGASGLASILTALRLRNAPMTVVLSSIFLLSWVASYYGSLHVAPLVPGPDWVAGTAVLLGSGLLSLPLTALWTRPLRPLFKTEAAKSRKSLVGQVCTISTGRVDARFGQAKLADGGAGMILPVRCATDNELSAGSQALIIGWDEEHEAFEVEPMDDVLERRGKVRVAPD